MRVGVLGLTTPGHSQLGECAELRRTGIHETVSEAKKWVPILREKEKVDVVVITMHMGIEEDLRTGNQVRRRCRTKTRPSLSPARFRASM